MGATSVVKVTNPVRKGDAVLVQRSTRSYVIGSGASESVEWVPMLVASSTRSGEVKEVSDYADGSYPHKLPSYWDAKVWTVPVARCAVVAMLEAFASRTWPNSTTGSYPFSDFDEAAAFVRSFALVSA